MKKQIFLTSAFLFFSCFFSLAFMVSCTHLPLPATPTAPTPTPGPTCVWTPIAQIASFAPSNTGTFVIRNSTDWNNAQAALPHSIPTPAPPVDLNQWMLVGVNNVFSCNLPRLEFTSICTYSDHIVVDYSFPIVQVPTVVPTWGPTPTGPPDDCNYVYTGTILAALPQSNLPVYFNSTPTPPFIHVAKSTTSSHNMESKKVKRLHFIGQVVDLTGWLGGYNFQWAWSSGWAAGQEV